MGNFQRYLDSVLNESTPTDYEYVRDIIDHNSEDKIFPITDKANHGISFDIWEKVLKDKGIKYTKEKFNYLGSNREGTRIRLLEKLNEDDSMKTYTIELNDDSVGKITTKKELKVGDEVTILIAKPVGYKHGSIRKILKVQTMPSFKE
jgi:hypothetical protein